MDPSTRSTRILVVGAGVSGLSAALLAVERGCAVDVVEEQPSVGGMIAPFRFRGVSCDLGSHRLHREALADTVVARLLAPIRPEPRPRRGVLLLGGRRIAYPPAWSDLARGLGPSGVPFALGFFVNRGRFGGWDRARVSQEVDVGFAAFVRGRVGRAAYEAFYRPYVEKVWGLAAEEVSQTVAKARVSTTAPWRLVGGRVSQVVARALGRERRGGEFLYPPAGMSALVEHLRDELAKRGVVARPGVAFDGTTAGRWDRVLFSGRLRDLSHASKPPRSPLDHRGVYLLYLSFPVERIAPYETWYTPEARYWFGRVSEPQNYSPSLARPGETTLCVEIPEGRWGRGRRFDHAPELDEVVRQLAEAEIVPRSLAPVDVTQRFLADVYPLYRRGWIADWEAALDDVDRLGNVTPFGRQGLFLHCNIDHCMRMGADAVEHVLTGASPRAWRAQARLRIGLRVRD